MRIMNFGYAKETRLLNVKSVKYKVEENIYINIDRNAYIHPEYREILDRVLTGQELLFDKVTGFETDSIGKNYGKGK